MKLSGLFATEGCKRRKRYLKEKKIFKINKSLFKQLESNIKLTIKDEGKINTSRNNSTEKGHAIKKIVHKFGRPNW